MLTTYDKTDPKSIEEFAKQLIGHTFEEVLSWDLSEIRKEYQANYDAKQRKGGLGNLIEEQYFGYKANSDSLPDFEEAGVELKVTPFEKKKDGALLIITHSTKILEALHVDYTHVMVKGNIVHTGDGSLVDEINANGFEKFIG